jgi:glycosyltransferase involved in cell wall biosynthesis
MPPPDIIFIAYYFPPHTAIGGARPFRFYRSLKKSGRNCWVVTASQPGPGAAPDIVYIPDPTAILWDSPPPSPPPPFPFTAHVERLFRCSLLPGGVGITWAFAAARQCRAIAARFPERSFVVVSTFPPVGVLLAGLLVSLTSRLPWVADFRDPVYAPCQEDYPGAVRFAAFLWHRALRRAHALIANTLPLADLWRSTHSAFQSKIHLIWNGFDADSVPAPTPIPERPYRVLSHIGSLYHDRTPTPILRSLLRLRASHPALADVRIQLIGPADPSSGLDPDLCQLASQQGWLDLQNTVVPKSEALTITQQADFLLLLQPQSNTQVPGKLFEYIAVGRPIVALVPPNSPVEYILSNSGIPYTVIHPDEPESSQDDKLLALLSLPPSPPTPFSPWFQQNFNSALQTQQLTRITDTLVP